MFNPIIISQENDESIVYEYKTAFLWILYIIVAIIIIGYASKIHILSMIGLGLMLAYFLTVSIRYIVHGKMIRQASSLGAVQFSGSKWSFSNPLRVTIPKQK